MAQTDEFAQFLIEVNLVATQKVRSSKDVE
jgi:hypothetical protein